MWRIAVLFILIVIAPITIAHAGAPKFEEYNGPFQVAPDSTTITLADGKVKYVAQIDKELLRTVKPTKTIKCILPRSFSGEHSEFWVSHVFVDIGGESIPVCMGGSMLFGGKNLVLTTVDIPAIKTAHTSRSMLR